MSSTGVSKLSELNQLPEKPGLYFVLAEFREEPGQLNLLYIGTSASLADRWRGHKLKQFLRFLENRGVHIWIYWELLSDQVRKTREQELIEQTKPILNQIGLNRLLAKNYQIYWLKELPNFIFLGS
jgi:predicted GIY-YIG superfamily endonuclease